MLMKKMSDTAGLALSTSQELNGYVCVGDSLGRWLHMDNGCNQEQRWSTQEVVGIMRACTGPSPGLAELSGEPSPYPRQLQG